MRLTPLITAASVAILAFAVNGCATAKATRPLSVAVAIISLEATKVSPAQAAQIRQALKPEIERAGYILATDSAIADLVLTVSFVPVPRIAGGRIKLASLEPTADFRRATEGAESAESKQMRRLERELQSTAEALGRNLDTR